MEQTFQSYSTFVTKSLPAEDYETAMTSANAIYSPAKTNWDRRDVKERDLARAGKTAEAYLEYVSWERTGKKAKEADPMIARNLYQRALKDHPSDWSVWEAYLQFWRDVLNAAVEALPVPDEDDAEAEESEEAQIAAAAVQIGMRGLLEAASGATKNLPYMADSWVALMRAQEKTSQGELVDGTCYFVIVLYCLFYYIATFSTALSTQFMSKDVEALVKLSTARLDFHRRLFEDVGPLRADCQLAIC